MNDNLKRPLGDLVLVAAASETKWAKASAARRAAVNASREAAKKANVDREKFTPKTQPRDIDGRFKKILARLKLDLGTESTQILATKIEAAEAAQVAGNYADMRMHGNDLIKLINDVDLNNLTKGAASNLRRGSTDLGKIMAFLPLPQGNDNATVRFSDLPPAAAELVRNMLDRAKTAESSGKKTEGILELESYLSGARTMTSDELASSLNKILRGLI